MAHRKRYIETDVLTEAKRRLHHIYDTHDAVVVAFSGGKDSLATLHLTHEVAQERGIDKVDAVFRDEELIPDDVIEFVERYRHKEWLDLRWLCVPLHSHKYVLGKTLPYVQWDPNREWVRPKPEFGLTEADLNLEPGTVLSQYDADDVTAAPFKGKVCILTGLRASEGLTRLRACLNKLNENYITASASARAVLGKPIFDWEENDVFRYFYDRDIAYCQTYDAQMFSGRSLRVCSILCSEPAKDFAQFRAYAPDLYDRVMDIFPEMQAQERYFRELNRDAIIARYGESLDTVEEWVRENLEGPQRRRGLSHLKRARVMDRNDPGCYPADYFLKCFMSGEATKRMPQPVGKDKR